MNKREILGALRRGANRQDVAPLPPPPADQAFTLNMSLAAQEQMFKDSERDLKKDARAAARDEASVAEWTHYLKQAQERLVRQEIDWQLDQRVARSRRQITGGTLMAQVTDVHVGATVRRDDNVYDTSVLARRLAAYSEEIISLAHATEAEELVIALTGDIFDSKIGKMRTDKVLHSEGPACWSFMVGRELICQFIDELVASEAFGRVRLTGISGNEARLMADRGHGELMATDNWDALLNGQLASYYAGSDVECEFGVNRLVVEAEGWKVLLMHGDQGLSARITQKECQSILKVHGGDFGLSGHIHDPHVTGHWVRGGSLIGTDSYAGEGLNLSGYASQTIIHLLPGRRNTHVIDLQHCDDVEGYIVPDFAGAFGIAEQ